MGQQRPRGDRRPVRFRQTEASRMLRAAADAGVSIREIALRPDGSLSFIVAHVAAGEPPPEPAADVPAEVVLK